MKKTWLLILSVLISSCQFFRSKDIVVYNDFQLHGQPNVLCFDLQNDDQPTGSLIVQKDGARSDHFLHLPFQIKEVDYAEDIWSTSSSYQTRSYINYKLTPGNDNGISMIRFQPTLSEVANELAAEDDLPDGVYLKRAGLDRKFLLKYKDAVTPLVNVDTIGLIGVKLPRKSVGKELEHGMTTVPQAIFEEEQIKYFNANKLSNSKVLKIGYTLPFNANMEIALNLLIKFISSFAIPMYELVFIHGNQQRTARRKKILKWILFAVELIIVSILFILMYNGIISGQSMADAAIVVIGALATLYIATMKG